VEQHTAALPVALADKARGSLGAAQAIGQRLGSGDLASHANSAFVHGVSLALIAASVLLVGGALFVALRAPGRAESEANAGPQVVPAATPADAA
jgi:hypothetical protein